MTASCCGQSPIAETSAARVWLAAAGLAIAAVLAYANSFDRPFVFDDLPSIVENPSIRQLWPLSEVLAPSQPGGLTVSGRPLVNLSLALNYALSGDRVGSYHAVNLLLHLLTGLCLFGIVRRTLLLPALCARYGAAALPLAWSIAALWLLHPLQTESVTYIVQRAESLAGLFYLLTLYAFIRAVDCHPLDDNRPVPRGAETAQCHPMDDNRPEAPSGPRRVAQARRWFGLGVVASFLGMASKEVVVSVPLMVLLYDRTFVSGTFRAAWRARRGWYLALAATWLLLAFLVVGTGSRGGTAGFGTAMSSWSYALTQCRAIVRYLALSVWPDSLVFDYGLATVRSVGEVLPQALLVVGLVVGAGWALLRHPTIGFLGAWFFALLAPSSSFVPVVTQTMAEHRMYLPVAAVVALLVFAGHAWLGARRLWLWTMAAAALALLTGARNRDYRSEAVLWADTAAKWPTNARAHNNLGQSLFRAGQWEDSIRSYERALQLQPDYPETHYNLGVALVRRGDLPGAVAHYETALRIQPDYPEALNNLGNALMTLGRGTEAIARYEEALRRRPGFAEAQNNLGNAFLHANRPAEAEVRFTRALQLKPDYPEAHYNRGNALAARQQMAAALESYRRALQQKPDYADAHVNAGNALLQLDRPMEALRHYEKALAANPTLTQAHLNLGSVMMQLERWAEAIPRFEAVLRAMPNSADAHRALGYALAKTGRAAEAIPHYESYLRAVPDDATARAELAEIRARR